MSDYLNIGAGNDTKGIKERGHLLSPHWDQTEKNILVGVTHDKVELHLSDELRNCMDTLYVCISGLWGFHNSPVDLSRIVRNLRVRNGCWNS